MKFDHERYAGILDGAHEIVPKKFKSVFSANIDNLTTPWDEAQTAIKTLYER